MRLALMLALLATGAAAQTPDSTASTAARRPTAGVVLGSAAVGLTAVAVGRVLLRAAGVSEDARGAAFLLYPVGAAVGVTEIGRRQGRHGTLRGAAVGAARGSLFAAGGVLLLGYGVGQALDRTDGASGGAAVLAGLVAVLIAPPYAAAAGYNASDVQPVVLVGPDGERTAGLSLRIGL